MRPLVALALPFALIAACGLETITVPANVEKPRAVVHIMLDPGRGPHLAILTSTRLIPLQSYSGQRTDVDSVVGPPISGALLMIKGEDGDSAIAVEDSVGGVGRGRYRFYNTAFAGGTRLSQIAIVQGRRYRLRVETPYGTITGETKVPIVNGADVRETGILNVERDTLITSANATGAAGYMVAGESALGGRSIRVVPQLYRSLWTPRLGIDDHRERATFDFIGQMMPGFIHSLGVAALDTNAVRFYSAGFDPFGDDTKGNTVRGGVGLFGSSVTLYSQWVHVVGTVDLPTEGTWVTVTTSDSIPREFTLYDLRYQFDNPPILTSSYAVLGAAYYRDGVMGYANGFVSSDSVHLVFNAQGRGVLMRGVLRDGVLTLARPGSTAQVVYRRP